MTSIDAHIANKLIGLRKRANLTQEDMSIMLQMSRVNISNIEKGKQGITVRSVYLICSIFNITPNDKKGHKNSLKFTGVPKI